MVSQVVTFLLDGSNFKTLSSPSHVIYAMETCGQGFSLPIEEEESISKVINLYHLWALEKNRRPASIDEDPQFFLQVIFYLLLIGYHNITLQNELSYYYNYLSIL